MHAQQHQRRVRGVEPRNWSLAALIVLATVALALPRFGHTTPDSGHYIALADYFRGNVDRAGLHAPYAFRWLLPWLAAQIPGAAPAAALALCSLAATVAGHLCFARLLADLGARGKQWGTGMAMLIISFPTFNYGGAVLTDSAGFLVVVAASWLLLTRRYLMLGAALVVGVWIRESTVVMLPALWIFLLLERDGRGVAMAAVATIATAAAAVAARGWFGDLPAYYWSPTWRQFADNMVRPISWATVSLTLIPIGVMAAVGSKRWRAIPPRSRNFILATGLPCLALAVYGAMAAFMSGRFCWPLYLALVPLAAFGAPVRGPQIPGRSGGGVK